MSDVLSSLNEEQLSAVTSTEGFVRVIAAAGSGKTRALTRRFAYLVGDIGIPPENVLCVTFTNKAADEMRRRVRQLTGDNDVGHICTFHSFCVTVLQEDAHAIGYPHSFMVLDNSDIDSMLRDIYEERGLTLRDCTFSDARDMFEIRKTISQKDYYLDMIADDPAELGRKYKEATKTEDILFYGYLCREKKCFALDYNDLIILSMHIFRENPDIREKWQDRLEYIMIDEFQDIDQLQYDLMEVLCAGHGNLFVVGDPDQTIYTWRGASVKFIGEFDKAFPGTKTIMMMKNYRSTPQIVAAANSLIGKNKTRIKKDMIPQREDGAQPLYIHCKSEADEANKIADSVLALADAGVKLSDIAVLYRAHYVTRPLEEVFLKRGLPYVIYSGAQFYDRAEIKDALSYMRMALLRDDLSFARIANRPRRNIGDKRMQRIKQVSEEKGLSLYAALKECLDEDLFRSTQAHSFVSLIEKFTPLASRLTPSDFLGAILVESGYEKMLRTEGSGERLDNIAALKQAVYDYEQTCGEDASVSEFLTRAALFSAQDVSGAPDKGKLMTVHAAKGLEFPYVFLCSMEERVFPSKKIRSIGEMEEERRLAFVAMTRAKDGLVLTDSEGRGIDGEHRFPSRFIFDIDGDLLRFEDPPAPSLIEDAKRQYALTDSRFEPVSAPLAEGDRVKHRIMGEGTVIKVDLKKQVYRVRFDELDTDRNISFRAGLQKI